MLYKGTTISEGSGEGVVVRTGMQTELGRISELAESAEKETTPLQKRLDRLGRRLAWITLAIAAVIAGVGLLAGQDIRRMIETAISAWGCGDSGRSAHCGNDCPGPRHASDGPPQRFDQKIAGGGDARCHPHHLYRQDRHPD